MIQQLSPASIIDPDRYYRTRAGDPVCILAVDLRNPSYDAVVLVKIQGGTKEVVRQYWSNGVLTLNAKDSPEPYPTDLIEYIPPKLPPKGTPVHARPAYLSKGEYVEALMDEINDYGEIVVLVNSANPSSGLTGCIPIVVEEAWAP